MAKYSDYIEKLKKEVKDVVTSDMNTYNYSHVLKQAMGYTVLNFGKMFRATLCLAILDDLSGSYHSGINFAGAIEMTHAYGLIHDDLPALDDARFRRNKMSNHLVYGEAQAILAGDALQAGAYDLIAKGDAEPSVSLKLVTLLASLSGANGYVGGQSLDIISEHEDRDFLNDEIIKKIHYGKTGALVEAAVLGAGYLAKADDITIEKLKEMALEIGLTFQIRDDILDLTKGEKDTGKDAKNDLKKDKTTYPKLYGLGKSIEIYNKHLENSFKLINELLGKNSHTYQVVDEMLKL